ncbi:MAG: tetratricopeptide repeat protein [Lentisphaerae bacterium]|jgi:Flp pilus assembly protein TadD/chromosome segregation ATPase|nr:tetratricopeptide repeat protein [Lentisphaerota bacterium]MBT4816129.1 tetratricopeptide repeat protein [Lentisphaerota bacterium]MBT5607271.1 tetratricopeptide repeat protein [Lentisphaerota bacterium]MBT7058800.1 tetratricopeptide repeat protein [Lentisphaerota bacterium]MBT7842390.1 tetratricopeptide repeat protein [Lentisphaerota bacterium]
MNAAFRTLTAALMLGFLVPQDALAARFGSRTHEKAREVWMEGYLMMQEAGQAEKDGLLTLAHSKYKAAQETFALVRSEFPTWNPSLVSYRLKFCEERLSRLEVALSVDAEKLSKPDLVTLVRDLQTQKKGWDKKLSIWEERTESLGEQLNAAQRDAAELKQARAALAALENSKKTLEAERNTLQTALATAKQEAGDLVKTNQENEGLKNKVSALTKRAEALATETEEGKTGSQKLSAQLAAAEKKKEATEAELAALAGKIATLETSLQTAKQTAGTSGAENAKLKTQVSEVQKAYDTLNARFTEVSKKLDTEETETARLSRKAAQAEQLKKELAEKIREIEEAKLSEAKAMAAAREKGEHAKQLAAAQDELKAQSERYDKKLAVAQEELKANQARLAAQAKQQSEQLEAGKQEQTALAARVAALNAELQKAKDLSAQLESGKQAQATLAARIVALNAEVQKAKDLSAKTDSARQELLKSGLSEQEALRLTALPPRVAAEMARLKEKQGTVDLARLENLVKAERAEEVAKLQSELNTVKGDLQKSKKRIEQLKQNVVAREEAEARLVAERKKRIEKEREVARQEQAKKEALHKQLKQAADIENKGDVEAAIHAYKKALEVTPENQQALARLGILLTDRGQDVEAEHYLDRAFALNPNDTDVLLRLGFAQIRQEKVHLAVSALTRVAALEPKNADARRLLGLACSAVGWSEAAEAEFKKAFELNKESPDAAYNLAVLLATLDEPRIKEAKEWYEKAKKLGARPDPGLEKCLAQ